jgi:hypothetical protein
MIKKLFNYCKENIFYIILISILIFPGWFFLSEIISMAKECNPLKYKIGDVVISSDGKMSAPGKIIATAKRQGVTCEVNYYLVQKDSKNSVWVFEMDLTNKLNSEDFK